MATTVADWAVIGFIRDYDPENLGEQRIYQITDGGVKTNKTVGVSNGKSIGHFLVETVDRLEVVREATAGGWNAPKRFRDRELQECLRCDAIKSYKKLAKNNYPDPADKTNANYEERVRLIPTDLGDHAYLGNKVRHYMMNKVHFMSYCLPDGRRYKPTDIICRMCQLRGYGNRLENSMPGNNIVTGANFLQLVWNIFPETCRVG